MASPRITAFQLSSPSKASDLLGIVHILLSEALPEDEMRIENFDQQIWVTTRMGSELEKGFLLPEE